MSAYAPFGWVYILRPVLGGVGTGIGESEESVEKQSNY